MFVVGHPFSKTQVYETEILARKLEDVTSGVSAEVMILNLRCTWQGKAFMAPGSLSFPGGANELTPPGSDKTASMNGSQQLGSQPANGTGVTPATPAATPGATQGGSGLTPTLQ